MKGRILVKDIPRAIGCEKRQRARTGEDGEPRYIGASSAHYSWSI